MSALFRLANRSLLERNLAITRMLCLPRQINTSGKKDDTSTVVSSGNIPPVTVEDFANPNPKNWVSWGFDVNCKETDRTTTHLTLFFSVTLCLVFGTFIWSYLPDTQLRDWAQREGYLELRRRERAGLDLVNPNYVDPENVKLPTDEELGDTEIII